MYSFLFDKDDPIYFKALHRFLISFSVKKIPCFVLNKIIRQSASLWDEFESMHRLAVRTSQQVYYFDTVSGHFYNKFWSE